jgi:V8-like Glu-specific endopeptidase/subtilisin-like proprotein convertase family protein
MMNRLGVAAIISLLFLQFVGCGNLTQPGTKGTVSQDSPSQSTDDSEFGAGKGDIHGNDDRKDLFQVTNPTLRRVAESTAVMVKSDLDRQGSAVVLNSRSVGERRDLCPDVRFSSQPAAGSCSAFLIGSDIVVTAGHCIGTQRTCDKAKFIFGYWYDESTNESVTRIPKSNVYQCDSIVEQQFDPVENVDFGVYRLASPVKGRPPLDVRTAGRLSSSARLAILGYPLGMPLKIVANKGVFSNDEPKYFSHLMDTFGGNSGAAVVNTKSGKIEGVHVRGAPGFEDKKTESGETCQVPIKCEEVGQEDRCTPEEASRARQFVKHLPNWDIRSQYSASSSGDSGLISTIRIDKSRTIDRIKVSTTISGADAGDLLIELYKADESGERAVVFNGESSNRGYGSGLALTDKSVETFEGDSMEGEWRLSVKNRGAASEKLSVSDFTLAIRSEN